jgi:hypothetical protein
VYHVFECDYDSYEFKGSAPTLKEAYDLVKGDCAELYENTADDLNLKHVADFVEESHAIGGDYDRVHRQRAWFFKEDKRIEIMEEYTECWIPAPPLQPAEDGQVIRATGLVPIGQWVREE